MRAFFASGALERGHAVGHRLHTGQGRTPLGERAEKEERRHRLRPGGHALGRWRQLPAEEPADVSVPEHAQKARDEEIGRQGEERPRLADAPQVGRGDRGDAEHAEQHAIVVERRERGGERGDPRRHAHRDGEHVVDEERGARDQARQRAEVVLRDDVGAPTLRIGQDGLAIRAGDDGDQEADRDADGHRIAERGGAREHQDEQDLLGRVGDGGQGVRREHRERASLGQPLVSGLSRRERPADEDLLERADFHRLDASEGPTLDSSRRRCQAPSPGRGPRGQRSRARRARPPVGESVRPSETSDGSSGRSGSV